MITTDLTPASTLPAIDLSDCPGPVVVTHTITTFVGVNLNGDLSGLPKSLNFGGVERMRVSAQALTRAARGWVREHSNQDDQAARSRLLPRQTARALQERGFDPADAVPAAALIVTAAGLAVDPAAPDQSRVMAYVRASAPGHLADVLAQHWDDLKDARQAMEDTITTALSTAQTPKAKKGKAVRATDAAALVPKAVISQARLAFEQNTEIALFGRFLTEIPHSNVRSAVSVAHGLSVDGMDLLTDEFSAVDDWQDNGVFSAGMLGAQHLASGTLYRTASLDRRTLRHNLRLASPRASEADIEDEAQRAERLFVTAATYTLPNTKASRTGSQAWPTLAIAASADHALTAAAAFDTPIEPPAGTEAARRLADYLRHSGQLRRGTARWIPPAGEDAPRLPEGITLETT
jgi:CRISPR system Cascade subunit CasC